MPNIDKWSGNTMPLALWSDDVDQGVDNAKIVADDLTSITIIRGGVAQSAQNVRIVPLNADNYSAMSEAGVTGQVEALVIGYKGHPTISDTSIQPGDRFAADGVSYEIVALVPEQSDTVQAYARVRS